MKRKFRDIYVSNRIYEIRSLVETYKIKVNHVSTKSNPADLISRGCESLKLLKNKLWLHGPSLVDLNINISQTTTLTIPTEIQPQWNILPSYPLDNIRAYKHVHNVMSYVIKFVGLNVSPLELLVRQEQRLHSPSLYTYLTNKNVRVTPDIVQLA